MGVQHAPPPIPIAVVKEHEQKKLEKRNLDDPDLYHPRRRQSTGIRRPDGRGLFDIPHGGSRF